MRHFSTHRFPFNLHPLLAAESITDLLILFACGLVSSLTLLILCLDMNRLELLFTYFCNLWNVLCGIPQDLRISHTLFVRKQHRPMIFSLWNAETKSGLGNVVFKTTVSTNCVTPLGSFAIIHYRGENPGRNRRMCPSVCVFVCLCRLCVRLWMWVSVFAWETGSSEQKRKKEKRRR